MAPEPKNITVPYKDFKELCSAVQSMDGRVKRVETAVMGDEAAGIKGIVGKVGEHEKQHKAMEVIKNKAAGLFLAIWFGASIAGYFLIEFFKSLFIHHK